MKRRGSAAAATRAAPIELRGSPPRLAAIVSRTEPMTAFGSVEVDLPGAEAMPGPMVAQAAPAAGGLAWVYLTIPEWTPPGTYQGLIRWGDTAQPLVLSVEPFLHVNLLPDRTEVEAPPATDVIVDFQLLNAGNVPIDVPRTDAFAMADAALVSRVLGRATTADPAQGVHSLARLSDELMAGRGGVARVRVSSGSGRVEPGDLRRVRATVKLADGLRAGRTYSGSWRLGDSGFSVRVDVTAGRPGRKRNQEETTT